MRGEAPSGAPRPLLDPPMLAGGGDEERAQCDVSQLPGRLERYGKARRRARSLVSYLDHALKGGEGSPETVEASSPETAGGVVPEAQAARRAAARLNRCGEYLLFRHYWTVDQVRLHQAEFCKQHLLCPLCAIRRAAKQTAAYLARFEQIRLDQPQLIPAFMTYTVKNGPDLGERMNHLRKGLRTLTERRRAIRKGNRGSSEWGALAGAVGTLEVTNRGKGWHPHAHMLVLLDRYVDQKALSAEWRAVTGDSFVVGITRLDPHADPIEVFVEVFKYALKFSDLSPEQIWNAARTLRGQRLLFSLGCFRGVEVSEELTDEPLDGLPFTEFFYRYLEGIGYSL
jgi:hypothetical protein